MCGIFGSPNIDDSVRAMLPFLGIAMQTRGRDAWGASDGDTIIKHVGELTDTWIDERDTINTWKAGIFHTRGASVGSAKVLENAHPFCYNRQDGDRIIGIHNGAITNHNELDTKYHRDCKVDSMHLWMHRAEGLPWSDIEGWGNLAWWETTPEGLRCLNLTRFNSDNLVVARLQNGAFVFASELVPIQIAARMCGNPVTTVYRLEEFRHYWCAPNAGGEMTLWRSENCLPFKKPITSAPWEGYMSGMASSGSRSPRYSNVRSFTNLDGYCAKCATTRVNTKDSLMCIACFGELSTGFYKWKYPVGSSGVNGHYPGVN